MQSSTFSAPKKWLIVKQYNYCYGLKISVPQNSYVGIPVLNVMILGGGVFGSSLGQECRAFMNGIGALTKEISQRSLVSLTLWEHREKAPVMNHKESSPEGNHADALNLDFSASRTVRNKCSLFISHLVICHSSLDGLRQLSIIRQFLEIQKENLS